FFLNLPRSPAATPGPPAWHSGRPPPTGLAVDAPPDSAPPRAGSGLPATNEIAPWITASARAKTPGRHTPRHDPRFRAGSEKQTRFLYTAPVLTQPISFGVG